MEYGVWSIEYRVWSQATGRFRFGFALQNPGVTDLRHL